MPDPELGCEHLGSRRHSIQTGRTRSRFLRQRDGHQPPIIKDLFDDFRINEIGRITYNEHAFKSSFLCERLKPANIPDYWHIDGILDQYKAMILLEDVGEEQGPMFFKPATKSLLNKELRPLLHTTYAYGRNWGCYPTYKIIDDLGIDTYKATGKAGDAIFFDTLNVHRGSICEKGNRLGLVSYLGLETSKNQILRLLGTQ